MGFLPGVGTDVNRECAPLDEALPTARRHARVGPLVSVYPVVPLQVRLSVEALKFGELALPSAVSSSADTLTLLHDCQSHWKGREVGSFSTSSRSSMMAVVLRNPGWVFLYFWLDVASTSFLATVPRLNGLQEGRERVRRCGVQGCLAKPGTYVDVREVGDGRCKVAMPILR